MAIVIADRIKQTTLTTGSGTISLSGTFGGFQGFGAIGDGNSTFYAIENYSRWEVGIGTYDGGANTLTRDTVLDSSASGAKINMQGLSTVFCTYPADAAVHTDGYGNLDLSGFSGVTLPGSMDLENLTVSGNFTHQPYNEQPFTFIRTTSGNFFQAYVDDAFDRTVSFYTDATAAPQWRLGIKNSPTFNDQPPEYAYVYGEDGDVGLVSNDCCGLSLKFVDGLNITHKSQNLITGGKNSGVFFGTPTSGPAVTALGSGLFGSITAINGIIFPDGENQTTAYLGLQPTSGQALYASGQVDVLTTNLATTNSNVTTNTSNISTNTSGISANTVLIGAVSGWAADTFITTDTDTTYTAGSGLSLVGTTFHWTESGIPIANSGYFQYKLDNLPTPTDYSPQILANSASGVAISGWAAATFLTTDSDTTYTAGSGLSLVGTTFHWTESGIPIANSGYFETKIASLPDSDTTYTAGSGMELVGTVFHWTESGIPIANSGYFQTVIDSLPPSTDYSADILSNTNSGVAISGWAAGTFVTTDTDTTYTAGSGLSLVGTAFHWTESGVPIANSGYFENKIAAITDNSYPSYGSSGTYQMSDGSSGFNDGVMYEVSGRLYFPDNTRLGNTSNTFIEYRSSEIRSYQGGTWGHTFDGNGITIETTGDNVGLYFRGGGTLLQSDEDGHLNLRGGIDPQCFSVYKTYTSSTDYERVNIDSSGDYFVIATEAGTAGGTVYDLVLDSTVSVNGAINSYIDNSMAGLSFCDNVGGASRARLVYRSDRDYVALGLSAASTDYSFLICNNDLVGKSFDHLQQSTPTLFVHSNTNPDTDNTQWVSLTHDQNNAVLTAGSGDFVFMAADGSPSALTTDKTEVFRISEFGDITSGGNLFVGTTVASTGSLVLKHNTSSNALIMIPGQAYIYTLLRPAYAGTLDLGTVDHPWRDGYFAGDVTSATLAVRNGLTPGEISLYGTYTADDDFERLRTYFDTDNNVFVIASEAGDVGGTVRDISIQGSIFSPESIRVGETSSRYTLYEDNRIWSISNGFQIYVNSSTSGSRWIKFREWNGSFYQMQINGGTGGPVLFETDVDFSGDVTVSGLIIADSGIQLTSRVPAVTTNKLYNDGGTLSWNGSPIGGGTDYSVDISANTASGVAISGWADSTFLKTESDTLQTVTDRGATTTNTITAPSAVLDVLDMNLLGNGDQPTHSEGLVFYDSENHTLSLYNDEADVTLQIGQEQFLRVRNNTGATITNGTAVLITGAHGSAAPTISGAIATSESFSQVVGLATHDIEDSSFGYVTTYGIVRDVDTSEFSNGDEVFLSATQVGSGVNVSPTIPNYKISLGHVINSASSNGSILVQIGNPKLGGGDLKSEAALNMSGVPFVTSISDITAGGSQTDPLFVFDSGNRQLQVGSGIQLLDGVPSNTSNVLYNDAGSLYFNGSAIGGGTYTAGSGLTLVGTEFNTQGSGNFEGLIVNKAIKTSINTEPDLTTITYNMNDANVHMSTLGGNRTLAVENVAPGQRFMLRLKQDGTGGRTVTWFSDIKWENGAVPTLSSAANHTDWFGFVCTSGGYYDGCVVMSGVR